MKSNKSTQLHIRSKLSNDLTLTEAPVDTVRDRYVGTSRYELVAEIRMGCSTTIGMIMATKKKRTVFLYKHLNS